MQEGSRSSRGRWGSKIGLITVLATLVVGTVLATPASASKDLYPNNSPGANGSRQYGAAYSTKGWCDTWYVCGMISNARGTTVATNTRATRSRVSLDARIGSVAGSLSVGTSVSGSFSPRSDTCVGQPYEVAGRTASVNYGSGVICKVRSLVSIGTTTFTVRGSARVGTTWSSNSASASESGAFF